MLKQEVRQHVLALRSLADARSTEQGVIVFNGTLELLASACTDAEVMTVLSRLNSAMAGIEAHGFLTNEESRHVRELRSLQGPGNS